MSEPAYLLDDDTPPADVTSQVRALVGEREDAHAASVSELVEAVDAFVEACEAQPRRDERLLLVDDHVDFLRAMGAALEHAGYDVDLAPNAAAALLLSRVRRYAAAIVDVYLVGSSGVELVQQLRREQRGPDRVPVVLISGAAAEDLACLAVECDADDVATKPVAVEALVGKLERLLSAELSAAAHGP